MNKTASSGRELLKLLSSETRFGLLKTLLENEQHGGKLCVNDLADAIDMTHSATSHQLSRLEKARVIEAERCGQMVCYQLADTTEAAAIRTIMETLENKNPA